MMKSNFIPIVALLKLLLFTTSTYQVHSLEVVKDHEAPNETIDLISLIPASETLEKSNLRKVGIEVRNLKLAAAVAAEADDTSSLMKEESIISLSSHNHADNSQKDYQPRYLSSNISTSMQQMLDLINNERQKRGTDQLCFNDKLILAAKGHTNDMIQKFYFSHTSKDGSSMSDRIDRVNYSWSRIAENIAINSSVQGAHDALMRSTGHRNNILNPDLKQIGIGLEVQTQGRYSGLLYVTQVFGKPRSSGESCSGGGGGSGGTTTTTRTCQNEPSNWYDSDGVKYNCNWYASGPRRCANYGSGYRNFGKTANEACCTCGGGSN